MPRNKKAKPNPPEPAAFKKAPEVSAQSTEQKPAEGTTGNDILPAPNNTTRRPSTVSTLAGLEGSNGNGKLPEDGDGLSNTPRPAGSWYGAPWKNTPTKSAPIAEIAKESITTTVDVIGKAAEKTGSLRSIKRAPSPYMSPGNSTKSLPVIGSTIRVSVSMSNEEEPHAPGSAKAINDDSKDGDTRVKNTKSGQVTAKADQPSLGSDEDTRPDLSQNKSQEVIEEAQPGIWSSWIPRYGTPASAPARAGEGLKPPPEQAKSQKEPQMSTSKLAKNDTQLKLPSKTAERASKDEQARVQGLESRPEIELPRKPQGMEGVSPKLQPVTEQIKPLAQPAPRPRSWLGIWAGDAENKLTQSPKGKVDDAKTNKDPEPADKTPQQASTSPVDKTLASTGAGQQSKPDVKLAEGNRSSGWAFWSTNATTEESSKQEKNKDNQIATAVTSRTGETKDAKIKGPVKLSNPDSPSKKRSRPESLEVPNSPRPEKGGPHAKDKKAPSAAVNVLPKNASVQEEGPPKAESANNLLLPSLRQTFREVADPGLVERLARYFISAKPAQKHVNLIKDPPRIRQALSIGVHGYFPTPLVRTLIGQPRGTSVRFASNGASAIEKWCKKRGYKPRIEKIALEGEGKIQERVDLLWKLLLKYIDKIREADFILIGCHSQGVPVAVQLVAKLILFGCLSSARVGICAMAGVNLGPFPDYKSRWISGSAGELFDFASPNSTVSKDYEAALNITLRAGVKMLMVGSIDDQLVSLHVS